MKKTGFTLAEVLVTLGIVGVVAAIALPALNANTSLAQVGPKLGKAVAMFEQANQNLLTDLSVDALTDTGLTFTDSGTYLVELLKKIKGTTITTPAQAIGAGAVCTVDNYPQAAKEATNNTPAVKGIPGNAFLTKDGMSFVIARSGKFGLLKNDKGLLILGTDGQGEFEITAPAAGLPHNQKIGNVFIDINGPNANPNEYGTDAFVFELYNDGSLRPVGGTGSASACVWTTNCKIGETPVDARACAGHVFENNMKADYE